MPSLRLLSRMVAAETSTGSHYLVEWDEPGAPHSIVEACKVSALDGREIPTQGTACRVTVTEGRKKAAYAAKVIASGTKAEMEKHQDELERDRSVRERNSLFRSLSPEITLQSASQIPMATTTEKTASESPKSTAMGKIASKSPKPTGGDSPKTTGSRKGANQSRKTITRKKTASSHTQSPPENPKHKAVKALFNKTKGITEVLRASRELLEEHDCEDLQPTPPSPAPSSRPVLREITNAAVHTCTSPTTAASVAIVSTPEVGVQYCPVPSACGMSTPVFDVFDCMADTVMNWDIPSPIQADNRGNSQTTSEIIDTLKTCLEVEFERIHTRLDVMEKEFGRLTGALLKRRKKPSIDEQEAAVTEVRIESQEGDDPPNMWFGDPSRERVKLTLPSEVAIERLTTLRHSLPADATKYALRLLCVFFTEEELAESNCTPAEGRKLLSQDILKGIQLEVNFRFPVEAGEEYARWRTIVTKGLNNKCRAMRRKLRGQEASTK